MSQWVSESVQNDSKHSAAITAKKRLSPKIPLNEWSHKQPSAQVIKCVLAASFGGMKFNSE